jgi:fimbrial isopeptide formation D2 family protein/LPXTG-motif cell wall-anchored protein
MKKFLSLILVVALIAAMAIPAMAAETYTITIQNPAAGETYTAYKILDATYKEQDSTAIAYYYTGAASDVLYGILVDNGFKFDAFVDGKAYVKVVDDTTKDPIDYSTIVDAAKLAKDINDAVVAGTLTLTAAGSGNPTITVNDKGYYFVDTSLGSFCAIDTAKNVNIYEKNSIPTIVKEVQEDSNSAWYTNTAADGLTVGKATADIGQTLTYRLTVNTGSNANATGNGVDAVYTIVDTLPAGTDYVAGSAATTTTGITVNTTNAVYDATARTLTITLTASEVAALGQNANIVITYQATVTDEIAVADDNINTVVLTYKAQTSTSSANATTYKFQIKKTDKDGTALDGVTFQVTKVVDGTTYYFDGTSVWTTTEKTLTTANGGIIDVIGVDADTYTVTEIETLAGYNKLDAPITVTIAEDGTVSGNGVAEGVLTVINYSGTALPSTGGHGVYWFYGIGGALIVGAVVLLITKKRMSKEQ